MDLEIKRAVELGEDIRMDVSRLFVDGFGEHLSFFAMDPHRLAAALEHMFNLELFYLVRVDGEPAGIAALTDGRAFAIQPRKTELIRHFGWLKGAFAYFIFRREFQKPPALTGAGIAAIEFVATSRRLRGAGVASALMRALFALPQYHTFILEVADTNAPAVNLYRKLGFQEFKRLPSGNSRISGVNELIWMKFVTRSA